MVWHGSMEYGINAVMGGWKYGLQFSHSDNEQTTSPDRRSRSGTWPNEAYLSSVLKKKRNTSILVSSTMSGSASMSWSPFDFPMIPTCGRWLVLRDFPAKGPPGVVR